MTERAIDLLPTLFGQRGGEGVDMAIRATEGLADPAEIAASCELLTLDLLGLLTR